MLGNELVAQLENVFPGCLPAGAAVRIAEDAVDDDASLARLSHIRDDRHPLTESQVGNEEIDCGRLDPLFAIPLEQHVLFRQESGGQGSGGLLYGSRRMP